MVQFLLQDQYPLQNLGSIVSVDTAADTGVKNPEANDVETHSDFGKSRICERKVGTDHVRLLMI